MLRSYKHSGYTDTMLTRGDINSINNAIQVRDTLSSIRDREYGAISSQSRADGPRYKPQTENKDTLPLYDQNGNLFVAPLLSKDRALSLPNDMAEGSVVEYQDSTGEYYYGKVVHTDKRRQKIEVQNISKQEVEQLTGPNSPTKIYSLNSSNVVEHKASQVMSSLMSMLDPSENLVFKLVTLLLVGNIFETESVTDIFMAVYLRVISLAIAIIAVIYVSTSVFG